MNRINTLVWDWNGTLLDDAEICRSIINKLLAERNINTLSMDKYKDIFTFPVKDYYEKAGFDFTNEAFEIPADEFMINYHERIKNADLHKNSLAILEDLSNSYAQFILSAMEQKSLKQLVKRHKIDTYFKMISGINNHYADGKTAMAYKLINENGLTPKNTCLIGDTIHDHEVAQSIGCECILIAAGHQSKARLKTTGRLVLNNLNELKTYL